MAKGALSFVRAAHATSLLGWERVPEEQYSPYVQLGESKVPYDLNVPEALIELKTALRLLGEYHSNNGSTETRWKDIKLDEEFPSWDGGSADEFAMAIGRYKGIGWQVPGPYGIIELNGPVPLAPGLELVAGACRKLLPSYIMTVYEQWRAGSFAPPSMISGPSADEPVKAPEWYGMGYKYTPPGVRADLGQQIADVEGYMKADWNLAMQTDDPIILNAVGEDLGRRRLERDQLVDIAISEAPVRTGTTTVEHVDQQACAKASGKWDPVTGSCELPEAAGVPSWMWWLAVPVGAAAVYWYTKDKNARTTRTARRNRRREPNPCTAGRGIPCRARAGAFQRHEPRLACVLDARLVPGR